MRRSVRNTTVAVVLSVAAACSDGAVGPGDAAPSNANTVAKVLAAGMRSSQLRGEVRDALRASLFTEHKLVLQEFAMTTTGRHLVEAGAAALKMDSDAVFAIISGMPRMDFYVPSRFHRLHWMATEDVVVAALSDNTARRATGYTPTGAQLVVDPNSVTTVFLIEPAEVKDLRIGPQAAVPRHVIQDSDDGEEGGAILTYRDGKLVEEVQLAQIHALTAGGARKPRNECAETAFQCETDGGGGGGGSIVQPPPDPTYLEEFWTNAWDGFGTMEIEFRARYWDENGVNVENHNVRKTGVNHEVWINFHEPLLNSRIRDHTSGMINVEIIETDAFSNDNMGNRYYFWDDNNVIRSILGSGDTSQLSLKWTPRS